MLFRPEEIHGASGIRNVLEPFPEGNGYISHKTLRFFQKNFPILDLHPDGLSAIKTWGIDPDLFAGKQPADRQRLETSLPEPLLLSIYCDPILCGEVVKGCKRGDIIRVGKQPARDAR